MRGFRRLAVVLLIVVLGLVAPVGFARPTVAAKLTSRNAVPFVRGDSGHTGAMPGPGPAGDPTYLWGLRANGYANDPVVDDGVAYISTGTGELYAVNIDTSEVIRDYKISDAPLVALAVQNNVLYVGVGSAVRQTEAMYLALNAATGKELWRFTPGGTIQYPRLTIVGKVAYVIGHDQSSSDRTDQTLYALDVSSTPRIRWQYSPGGPISSVAISDSMIYFGSKAVFYGLHAASGEIVFEVTGATDVQSPVVERGIAVFADRTANIWYAVDGLTGKQLWAFQPEPYLSVPALVDGVAYINGDSVLYALDAETGEQLWSFRAGDDFGPASVVGDTVYVGSWLQGKGGALFALDAATGKQRWEVTGEGNFAIAQPVIVDGLILLTTGTGEIYAIGGSR